ncbi:OsmC family protein [Tropicimonas sp. TH_r6]|uniref:OsmC family protein n=1 Tax=Tropicimonas sp. TH_r6 TaxID=3082085 RepID=UPI002953F665|nr:OsmC family protein [Tropicimonas sp. TH_r6]MDV7145485.1 OsmC family protein [Tropicimonas sp. TH_r6]
MKFLKYTTAIVAASLLVASAVPVTALDNTASGLKSVIEGTQEAFRANPEMAKATFMATSTVVEGFRTEATMREHKVTVDFTEGLGGGNAGPSPVELVLASLGTCQAMTYRAYAIAMGIPVDEITVHVEGDIDLRGFLAVDDTVRPGFNVIRMKVDLVSDASSEDIKMLQTASEVHCPMLDIVANPVPVELEVVHQ